MPGVNAGRLQRALIPHEHIRGPRSSAPLRPLVIASL
jgi:hypothetical protein